MDREGRGNRWHLDHLDHRPGRVEWHLDPEDRAAPEALETPCQALRVGQVDPEGQGRQIGFLEAQAARQDRARERRWGLLTQDRRFLRSGRALLVSPLDPAGRAAPVVLLRELERRDCLDCRESQACPQGRGYLPGHLHRADLAAQAARQDHRRQGLPRRGVCHLPPAHCDERSCLDPDGSPDLTGGRARR